MRGRAERRAWAGDRARTHTRARARQLLQLRTFQSDGDSGKRFSKAERADRMRIPASSGKTRGMNLRQLISTQPVSALVMMATLPNLAARAMSAMTLSCSSSSCAAASGGTSTGRSRRS